MKVSALALCILTLIPLAGSAEMGFSPTLPFGAPPAVPSATTGFSPSQPFGMGMSALGIPFSATLGVSANGYRGPSSAGVPFSPTDPYGASGMKVGDSATTGYSPTTPYKDGARPVDSATTGYSPTAPFKDPVKPADAATTGYSPSDPFGNTGQFTVSSATSLGVSSPTASLYLAANENTYAAMQYYYPYLTTPRASRADSFAPSVQYQNSNYQPAGVYQNSTSAGSTAPYPTSSGGTYPSSTR